MKNLIYLLLSTVILGCASQKRRSTPASEIIPSTIIPPISQEETSDLGLTLTEWNLVHNHIIGATYDYFELAQGWRLDTVNMMVNPSIPNPYLKDYSTPYREKMLHSTLEQLYDMPKSFSWRSGDYVFYRYRNGKLVDGEIRDTMNYYGPRGTRPVVFNGRAEKGLMQGQGRFYYLDSTLLCEGSFKNGEIIGLWKYYFHAGGKLTEEREYVAGHNFPRQIIFHSTNEGRTDTLNYDMDYGRLIEKQKISAKNTLH